MHVLFRETHGLEETQTPVDLGQSPADMVVLSYSDSDLGAFAEGWRKAAGNLPTLRLANLAALRHPLSVDTYLDRTLGGAKAILVRLIGGESYWPYGLQQLRELAVRQRIPLAVLPADGRPDERLDAASTLPVETLRQLCSLCDAGGAMAAQAALALLAQTANLPAPEPETLANMPDFGWYSPAQGVVAAPPPGGPLVIVSFYRSYLTAADTAPVDALIAALQTQGFAAIGFFAPSLKMEAAASWFRAQMASLRPVAIINATAFSALDAQGSSPLDAADCPVFQVALSTAERSAWEQAERGLSPADLAMHVVLPEVDGRIFAGVISFKARSQPDPDLQFARMVHCPDHSRIAAVVARVSAWHALRETAPQHRQLALVLSTYPGKDHQMAHAVGLDALASSAAIITALADAAYNTGTPPQADAIAASLATATIAWPVAAYKAALDTLPPALRDELLQRWGAPDADPAVQEGAFRFRAICHGNVRLALQPERGDSLLRVTDYHDTSRTPCHGYVAFYLWLRAQGIHALVHVGAHGTLEWLPGKAVALGDTCWPQALTGPLPVIYPFIVNDPGEAAQAKRRIGALTLGHLPPLLLPSAMPAPLLRLERLLDEYSTADGLDPARRDRLIGDIRDEARSAGVERDLGLADDASAQEAITRIDQFVCDIKESQYGDGLHIYGSGDCADAERHGLLAALDGQRVAAGPSGSPNRGRSDVRPTGRNLFSVDPRAVPSRAAFAQGVKLAEELLRRHLQDHGDWPRGLIVDLWGSATMRTAGEEFAMALHLAGLRPLWDNTSERVNGFEVVSLALLGRPRIDVTLRVSGLFRDIFPDLARMFEAGIAALLARDEPDEDNPYRQAAPRVFAPRPGEYGVRMGDTLDSCDEAGRQAAGEAWLHASSWAIDAAGVSRPAREALEERVRSADSFVHVQDMAETDLLLASDYAAHQGGFAAAAAALGMEVPALYHLDTTRPDALRARTLIEEISRIVRARAANPAWADGMLRHGFRGAAEITATLEHLAAFAQLTRAVPPHLVDLYFEATLGRDDVVAFMARENPAALEALQARFNALYDSGLWTTRRNSIAALMATNTGTGGRS